MKSYAMAVVGGSKVQIDPSDPLFLHSSDHPGQPLVAEVFSGEDFDNWRRSVRIALSAKQKLSIIDGTYEKPAADSPLLPYWQRCNDMVISWLLNSMHKSIRDSVIFCDTASEIWKELNERYGQSNKARHFQAQKEVCCISQGDSDIVTYFNRAKKVWDEFTAVSGLPWCECKKCGCDVNGRLQQYLQEQKIIQFLMGLNETYTAVRGNILMMSPLPSLSQIYSLLVQEEKQRQIGSGLQFQTEGTSLNASGFILTQRKFVRELLQEFGDSSAVPATCPLDTSTKLTADGGRYVMPKNAVINFTVAEMTWDPQVWEDPMEFKPERFLPTKGSDVEFDISGSCEIKMMPFGAGRRICPGSCLAILHLEYFVANLVRKFEWATAKGHEVDLSEKEETTIVKKHPLHVRISRRHLSPSN